MIALTVFLQAGGDAGGGWINLIFLGAIMAVAYFFLILPQSRQRKKQAKFIEEGLKKGKRVITIGGIHGTVVELDEQKVVLLVDSKSRITVQRDTISREMTNAVYGTEESK